MSDVRSEDCAPVPAADRIRALSMHLLPHHALSALMHRATRLRLRAWKDWQIRWFIRRYGVDMTIAEQPDAHRHADFNSFFTRALRPDARPLCGGERTIACPADGQLSRFGAVDRDTLVQAKGRTFSLRALLGGDGRRAAPFAGGAYATVYLSPRDYHRVHMPLAGTLREMVHVPGRLFSVNTRSAAAVPRLFVRNERVVSMFDTGVGPMAVVLVGAVFVGSIEQVWSGVVTPPPARRVTVTRYAAGEVSLARGAEMGRFNMGSTVITVLGSDGVRWADSLRPQMPVRMGQRLGEIGPS